MKDDGSEIKRESGEPPKMHALHSSSALGVNFFQYGEDKNQVSVIAATCGFCQSGSNVPAQIVFEDNIKISSAFRIPPNIDVVIYNKTSSKVSLFAIECKFTEAYASRVHSGLKEKYFD